MRPLPRSRGTSAHESGPNAPARNGLQRSKLEFQPKGSSIMKRLAAILLTVALAPLVVAPPAKADPLNDLIAILPPGYFPDSPDLCQPIDTTHALATLQCGPNPTPGGPKHASYSIYQTDDAMAATFENVYNDGLKGIHVPCPGGKTNKPGDIYYGGTRVGLYACGAAPPMVIWMVYAPKFFGWAQGDQGDNLEDLYKWWGTAVPSQA